MLLYMCSGVSSDLRLAGVVVLDTTCVPRDADDEPVRVLPVKPESVWVLM